MKKIGILLALLVCVGCSNVETTVPKEKSNLTVGMVKKKIVKGITKQDTILEVFGAPNIITTNSKGNEVWNYTKSSYEQANNSKKINLNLLLFGASQSSALSNASTASFDLIIIFNSKGIVEDYKVISSNF